MTIVLARRPGYAKETVEQLANKIAELSPETKVINWHKKKKIDLTIEDLSLILRWGTHSNFPPRHAEVLGYGSKKGIIQKRLGCTTQYPNKVQDRWRVKLSGVTVPMTEWDSDECVQYWDRNFPVVARPLNHAGGRDFHLIKSRQELRQFQDNCPLPNYKWYLSEFIQKKREYRIFVMNNRVVWVAEKIVEDPTQPAWNVEQGGVMQNVKWGSWPLKACQMAVTSCDALGLFVASVDIIEDEDGIFYFLEANTSTAIDSDYRLTCTAKAAIHDSETKNSNKSALGEGWRGAIHPGVWGGDDAAE